MSAASTTSFAEIPIIDVSRMGGTVAEQSQLAEHLSDVCHRIGFFVAVDHGVDAAIVESVFDLMQRFFSLPLDQKQIIDKQASRHFRGWEAEGSEYTNNLPDIREQIDVWSEWPAVLVPEPDAGTPSYNRLLGPNQWMPEEILGGHREITLEWMRQCDQLADKLLALLALGLGLSEQHFAEYFGNQPMSLTKFIHYPPTPAGQAGVNPHHDAGFLTVLAPGPTSGLQVQNPQGDWIDVPTVPGGLVINLGEMLQGVTGNYFVATPHRVITAEERFSAGYFHGPSLDTPLDPLRLDDRFVAAVAASPRHAAAGFMARREETIAGVGEMASEHRPAVYGEQLWNYFERSYPENMALHYG
ncbi:MAG: isopenicillin N synthase-like dioxygenase [Acidimicrobiales bacterium]|jgi:isopenicillin N synthase-like dioxygenase